jgi:hypothetical protein
MNSAGLIGKGDVALNTCTVTILKNDGISSGQRGIFRRSLTSGIAIIYVHVIIYEHIPYKHSELVPWHNKIFQPCHQFVSFKHVESF